MESVKPRVSVIVPVWKAEGSIGKCVSSLLAQTFADFELILVDDGSLDSSGAACDALAETDARIKVVHIPHSGVSAARNAGMDAACAQWLSFVDSDDTVDADYLERLFAPDPQPGDLVMTGCVHADRKDGRRWPNYSFPELTVTREPSSLIREYRILNLGFPVCKLYDAALVRQAGLRFDISLSMHEDHVFYLNYLLLCKRFVLVPGMPYTYWHKLGSSSLSSSRHAWQELLRAGTLMADAMMRIKTGWTSVPRRAFRIGITLYGLRQILAAYRIAPGSSRPTVASEVRRRAGIFYHYLYRKAGFKDILLFYKILLLG